MAPSFWGRWLRSLFGRQARTYRQPVRRLSLEQLETRVTPASHSWTGGGGAGNTNWTSAANWSGGAPVAGDDLLFPSGPSSLNTTNDFAANTVFNSITFSGSGYTLTGNSITLGSAALGTGFVLVNSGATGETIGLNMTLGGAASSQQNFTVNFGATLTITGSLTGTSGAEFAKEGVGTLTLSADNSGFTGPFLVDNNGGALAITAPKALGGGTNTVTVNQGGQLQVNNVAGSIPANVILLGSGITNDGALLNVTGANTWTGTITLAGNTILGITAGSLNVKGSIGDTTTANLTKEGTGQLILSAANTYHGLTTINNGILTVSNPNALGAAGTNTPQSGTVVNKTIFETGTLQLSDPTGAGFTVSNELLTLNGTGFSVASLENVNGNNTWAGNVILSSAAGVTSSNIGAAAGTKLTISGVISDPNGATSLNKVDTGELILPTVNTYRGSTTVTAGIVDIRDSQALGTGTVTVNTGTALQLEVDNIPDSVTGTTNTLSVANTLSISGLGFGGMGGALRSVSGINTYTGAITLTGAATAIGVDPDPNPTPSNSYFTNDYSLTVTGGINGTVTFDKVGTGQLILPNANSYTAPTNIQQGWITIQDPGALGPRIAGKGDDAQFVTTVFNGAALHVKPLTAGGSINLTNNLILAGLGITHPFSLISQDGALMSLGGVNTFSGTIQLNGVVGIGVELLGPSNASELTLTGFMSDFSAATPGGITKLGSRRLIIQGPGTYTGPVDIQQGVIRLQNNTGLGAATAGTTVEAGAALELYPGNPLFNAGVTAGLSVWGEHLTLNGTGNTTFGDLPLTINSDDHLWHGPISLNNAMTFNIPLGARLTVNGIIDDTGNASSSGSDLTLTGGGELDLAGANTYRGTTYVNQGVLTLQNGQALGGGAIAEQQSVTLTGAGMGTTLTLTFNGQTTAAVPITGTAGTDTAALQMALNGLSTIGGAGGSVTVSEPNPGVFSVTFGGTLAGFSQPQLTATAGGPGTVAVAITRNGAGGTVVANGAQIQLLGNITVAAEPLIIQGNGAPAVQTNADRWFNVGPAPITGGQTPNSQAVTGRVTGVAVDPSDASVIYISTADGGAWKTEDGGKSWVPLFDQESTGVVFAGAIAVAPSDPRVIYLGTGEADNSTDSYYGVGVYKSTDSGKTWTLLTGGPVPNPLNGKAVSKIVVDPANPNLIYVASGDQATNATPGSATTGGVGVWRFNGTTWLNMTTTGPTDNAALMFPQTNATWSDVALSGGMLFAALGSASGPNSGDNAVYVCANPTSNTPSWIVGGFPTARGAGTIKIAVAGGTLYAASATTGGVLLDIQTSTDGGATWMAVPTAPSNYLGTQGNYDNAIVAVNASTVIVGGEETSAVTHAGHVLETTDGGMTWTDISVDTAGNGPHTNEHALVVDPNGNVIDANDGGVWRLNAATKLWTNLNGTGLAITQFNQAAVSPTNLNTAWGASQNNGIDEYTGSQTWAEVDKGTGTGVVVDPKNPLNVYDIINNSMGKSTTGGGSGSFTPNIVAGAVNTVHVDPINDNRIVVGIGGGILESTTGGASFVNLHLVANVTALSLAEYQGTFVADPGFPLITDQGANLYNPDTIYATDGTKVYVTKDHGQTWVTRGTTLGGSISDIEVDPRNRDTVYVTRNVFGGQEVFRSTDAGQTWINVTGNLPSVPVNKLLIDPRNGYVYLGTDNGVYLSTNNGNVWSRFGLGLPNVQVTDLELNQALNVLTAATHGRSLYQFTLDNLQPNSGALSAVSGSSVWAGPIMLAGDPVNNTVTINANGNQALPNGLSVAQLNLIGSITDLTPGSDPRLVKIGQGDVILGAANTYGGVTEVQQGQLVVQNPQALGAATATGNTVVDSGAALVLESSLQSEPITLNGNGFASNGHNTGALHNVSGTNYYTGALTLNTNSTIGVDSGSSLTIGPAPTLLGTGTITDNSANYNLTKEMGGLLVLSAANPYGGTTYVNQGVLQVQNAQALGGATNGVQVLDSAQLQLQTPSLGPLAGQPVVVTGKMLTLTGTGVFGTGALLDTGGNNTWAGPITLDSLPAFSPASLPVGVVAIDVTNATDTLTIGGAIGQGVTTGLSKVGAGRLVLTQTGTYGGTTYVSAGTLRIQDPGALGNTNTAAIQRVTIGGTPTGMFTLSFNGQSTAPLAFNATAVQVQTALANLSTIGVGNVTVTLATPTTTPANVDRIFTVTFTGTLTGAQPLLTVQGNGGLSAAVSTVADGGIGTLVSSGAALELDFDPLGVGASGTVTGENLVLNGSGPTPASAGALVNVSGNNTWASPITLQTNTAIGVNSNAQLTISGILQDPAPLPAPASTLTKLGTGTLALTAANTYTGVTLVNQGVVNVANAQALGLNTTELQTITVTGTSGSFTLGFNGQTTAALPVGASMAQVQTALDGLSTIGAGGVTVTQAGGVYSVSFSGPGLAMLNQSLLIGTAIGGGTSIVVTETTAGGQGGTVVARGATLQVQGNITVPVEALQLSGPGFNNAGALENVSGFTDTWAGPITLAANSAVGVDGAADTLTLSGAIGQSGGGSQGLTLVGPGIVVMTGTAANTYTGLTQVNQGILQLDKTDGVNALAGDLAVGNGQLLSTAFAQLLAGDQIADTSAVTVNSNGTFDLNDQTETVGALTVNDGLVTTGAGVHGSQEGQLTVASLNMTGGTVAASQAGSSVTLAGNVTATSDALGSATVNGLGTLALGNATPTFTVTTGPANLDLVVSTPITGTGTAGLTKAGAGSLELTNTETYPGTTTVQAGKLFVDGPTGQIGAVALAGGTLGGTGTVGAVTAAAGGGTLEPGTTATGVYAPGILTATGDATLNNATTYQVLLGGTTPGNTLSNYNQDNVTGAVNLGNANLAVTTVNGFTPAIGTPFVIMTATGGFTNGFGNALSGQPNNFITGGMKFSATVNSMATPPQLVLQRIRANTTTVISQVSPASPSVFGTAVTLTATVTTETGITPAYTGIVTFLDGSTILGTATPNSSGVATFTTAVDQLTGGMHSITAVYDQTGVDPFFVGSTSAAVSYTITTQTTTTTITTPSPGSSAAFGTPVTVTATVTPTVGMTEPTGTVNFYNGVIDPVHYLGGGNLANVGGTATASYTITAGQLTGGAHTILAAYAPLTDPNFSASRTTTGSAFTISKAATTTTVTGESPASPVFGQAVTLSATVTPTFGTTEPTGTVSFYEGSVSAANLLGTGTLVNLLGTATATFVTMSTQLAGGNHNVVAVYTAAATEINYSGSQTTTSFPFTVSRHTTVTAFTAATPSSQTLGQPVTFTATVTPTVGTVEPTGTVSFYNGVVDMAHLLGSGTLANVSGTATASYAESGSQLTVGPHTLIAVYTPAMNETNFSGSTSSNFAFSVGQATPTVAIIVSNPNPSTLGQAVTFTAHVTGTVNGFAPTSGTVVTFKDGSTTLGTGLLDGSGNATYMTSGTQLLGSVRTITATWAGDTNYVQATSPGFSQTVTQASSTTAITANTPNPSSYGQQTVTLMAHVTGSVAGYTPTVGSLVTFKDGSTPLGTAAVNASGNAIFVTTSSTQLNAGGHTITATWAGDTDYTASTSAGVSQTVNKANSTTTLTTSNASASYGVAVLTATVAPAPSGTAGVPDGTVTFTITGSGSSVGTTTVALTNGQATLVPQPGTYSITAAFNGGSSVNFNGSTSNTINQTVFVATPSVAVTSSLTPSAYGQPVTFTATVSAPGVVVPGGAVNFVIDGTTVASGVALNASGQAVYQTASLGVSATAHGVQVSYAGNGSFAAGSSALPGGQTVTRASTTVTLTPPTTSTVWGQPATFMATVTPASGTGPTGTVTFAVDGVAQVAVPVNGQGQATFTTKTLAVGARQITATYSGDGQFNGGSRSTVLIVNAASTKEALQLSVQSVAVGAALPFTVVVVPVAPGAGTATGMVTVYVDGTAMMQVGLNNGVATGTLTGLSQGTHTLFASYTGDNHFKSTNSGVVSETVTTVTQAFVEQAYLDLLQRPADPNGLAGWSSQLDAGLMTRTQVAQALMNSDEYRMLKVNQLYEQYLSRPADPMGLSGFVSFLRGGGTLEQVAAYLIGSPEYFNGHGGGSNDGFVKALYEDALGRPVDAPSEAYWDQVLSLHVPTSQIATAILSSAEYDTDLVMGFYQTFLRRAADTNGLNGNVKYLQGGGRDEIVIAALVGSPEYLKLVGG